MISTRLALLRQAQEYFHRHLLGIIRWDDVIVDKAIPIPSVKGQRDQGKVKDVVIASFNGFRMEMLGPFEHPDWPMGRVEVSRGHNSVWGSLDARTWEKVANFIKEQKREGDHDGTADTASAPARDDWGR